MWGLVHESLDWINKKSGGLADIHEPTPGRKDYKSTMDNFQVPREYLDDKGALKPESYGKVVPINIDPLNIAPLQAVMAEEAVRSRLPADLNKAQAFLLSLIDQHDLFVSLENQLLEANGGQLPQTPCRFSGRWGSSWLPKKPDFFVRISLVSSWKDPH